MADPLPTRTSIFRTLLVSVLLLVLPQLVTGTPAAADERPSVRPIDAEVTDRVIVVLRDGEPPHPSARSVRQRARANGAPDSEIDRVGETLGFVVLSDVPDGAIGALRRHPAVVAVGRERLLRPTLADTTVKVGADRTTADGLTGAGQAIAIIDTGVDATHPAMASAVTHEACFVTPTPENGDSTCPDGSSTQIGPGAGAPCSGDAGACAHGTHVAGIAAGRRTSAGAAGVAPGASIIAIQVFDDTLGASLGDILDAMDWVAGLDAATPVAALNLSLGTRHTFEGDCDGEDPVFEAFRRAAEGLRDVGVTVVAASGNAEKNKAGEPNAMSAPACISNIVAVGASTANDRLSSYSHVSQTTDLLAPGDAVWAPLPGGGYGPMSGTSMAAPHVAGAIAVLSQKWSPSPAAIRSALRETGTPVPTAVGNVPRLDVHRARLAPGRPPAANATHGDRSVKVDWNASSRGQGSNIVGYRVTAVPGGPSREVGAKTRSTTLTGLTNGSRYTVEVRAINQIRAGSARTSNLVIPKPPPPPHGFVDVPASSYYEHPVRWAKAEAITLGNGGHRTYGPHDNVTRAQMGAFLWRVMGEPTGYPHHGFTDVPSGAYYDLAVRWLKTEGITLGDGGHRTYGPQTDVTRAQMAAFLWRMAGEPRGYPHHGFTDMPSGAYYDLAVRWLKTEGITLGDGGHRTYGPQTDVTRAQMAAFLHRLAKTHTAWKAAERIPDTIAF